MQELEYQQYLIWGLTFFLIVWSVMNFFLNKNSNTERIIANNPPLELPKENQKKETQQPSSRVTITRVKKANTRKIETNECLEAFLKKEKTYTFDTTIAWQNTVVTEVIFKHKSMLELDQFLREQNLNLVEKQIPQIPEAGGILVGRPFFSKKNKTYRVLVEEFVAIEPEYHDTYQLEFNAQSIAKNMGDIQDDFPELILVGWFHTHPGHGLFLSNPDLRINETFFREPYQFAMEIDSISGRLDTGFFTRKKDGAVNNIKDKIADTRWHSWSYLQTTLTDIS